MPQDRTPDGIDPATLIPRTGEQARARAEALGLAIPDACLPGVVTNLALLQSHAANLLGPGQ